MMTFQRKTPFIHDQFGAIGESGKPYRLRLWKMKTESTLLNGQAEVIYTDWKIDTTDGRHVNQEHDGSLWLADTGEKLMRT